MATIIGYFNAVGGDNCLFRVRILASDLQFAASEVYLIKNSL